VLIFSVLSAECWVLIFSVLSAECWVLSAECWVLIFSVLSAECWVLIFSVLSAECWVLSEERKLAVGCWQAFTVKLKLPTAFTFFPQHSALSTAYC